IQSWDGNKWPVADVVAALKEINQLSLDVEKHLGVKMAPVETWGGGQVAQPARFLFEDPLENLEVMNAAAPNLMMQCLYRGRQGFGFKPVSEEVQKEAIEAAIAGGVRVFRVFDMMNDIENVKTGFGILKTHQKNCPNSGVIIEGSLCYITEPDGPRAWEFSDYADYAIELAKLGANEIVIKNYAGVGDADMVLLIQVVRAKLNESGFDEMKINLHMHGAKSHVMVDAIRAGADKVDVAIGELSDGPAHSNMRTVIHELLKDKFSPEQIDTHPVMQQLSKVEAVIAEVTCREPEVEGAKSFYNSRSFLRGLKEEQIEAYRVAGGAFSDLVARVQKQFPGDEAAQHDMFNRVLGEIPALWEKAGRPNTVTPGAKILIDQAVAVVLCKDQGREFRMANYTAEYLDLVTGRYGRNLGMEKGIGSQNFRDAVLIYRAMKIMNKAILDKKMDDNDIHRIMERAQLGIEGQRVRYNGQIALGDPSLERTLMLQNAALEGTALERLKIVAEKIRDIDPEVRAQMIAELRPGRSPTPTEGMDRGKEIVCQTVDNLVRQKRESGDRSPDSAVIKSIKGSRRMSLFAMLLKDRDQFGNEVHLITHGLINKALNRNLPLKPTASYKFGPK
ncbi:MAG TPA: hypothetical protein PKW15_06130, partial [Alphaproteobacteria bacterium]|nr:hypothetical protein [Alphaproteobacteria bacterium]